MLQGCADMQRLRHEAGQRVVAGSGCALLVLLLPSAARSRRSAGNQTHGPAELGAPVAIVAQFYA